MLKSILITTLINNVLGQNYPHMLDRGEQFNMQKPFEDPLKNLKAHEKRFQEQVLQRSNLHKSDLRSSDNGNGFGPYSGIPKQFIGGMFNRKPLSNHRNTRLGSSDLTSPSWMERKAMYDEFDEVEDRISRADQWEEFKVFATKLQEDKKNNPNHEPLNDLRKILEWSRNLEKPKPPRFSQQALNQKPIPRPKPSAGMASYWGNYDTDAGDSGPGAFNGLSAKEVREKALRKLQEVDEIEKQNSIREVTFPDLKKSQTPVPQTTPSIFYSFLPKEDDFKAPIRWVPLTSNDTRDGLAKVTDPRTGQNRQYHINGTILVPVIDYNVERLGLTTSAPPVLTSASSSLRTVVRNIDMKSIDETDWLVFETALDVRERDNQCFEDGCQARCQKLGCDSMCKGDTCATGCVGGSCKTACKGPGCLSMCIGTGCTATCDGMSCEARCRGNGCEATCRSFSCRYAMNGQLGYGGGVWEEHYPQYRDLRPRGDY